jgi:hypothetical protein
MPHDAQMERLGRIVAAGFPHHVTQRGNRRQTIGQWVRCPRNSDPLRPCWLTTAHVEAHAGYHYLAASLFTAAAKLDLDDQATTRA